MARPTEKELKAKSRWVRHISVELAGENPEAIRFRDTSPVKGYDKLDWAVLGIARQHAGAAPVLAYSQSKILEVLTWDGMTDEDASEWYCANIQCLAVGIGTPIIVEDSP